LHNTLINGNLEQKELDRAIEMQKKLFPKGIPECGTDALRMGLLSYPCQGKDICLDIPKIDKYRKFCNKIWNAFKIATLFNEGYIPSDKEHLTGHESDIDKWILHRLNFTIQDVHESFKSYDSCRATTAIYNFWWLEFCDVYLEAIKPTFKNDGDNNAKEAARNCLYICFDLGLRILHPFMPFVTEELWQRLPKRKGEKESISISLFPQFTEERNHIEISNEFDIIYSIIKIVRQLENTYSITKFQKPNLTIGTSLESNEALLNKYKNFMITLAYTGEIDIKVNIAPIKGCAVGIVNENLSLYLHIGGLIDKNKELSKLETKMQKIEKDIATIQERINQPDYHLVPDIIKEQNSEKIRISHTRKIKH